jgi:hypothetical protein
MTLTSARELVTLEIRGMTPLVCDNVATSMDPQNPQSILIAELLSQSKSTEQHAAELSLLEWRRTLYTDAAGRIIYPTQNLVNSFTEAARAFKLGTAVERGAIRPLAVELPLRYGATRTAGGVLEPGPANLKELEADGRYLLRVPVNGNPSRGKRSSMVVKSRALFPEWELTVQTAVFLDLINWADFERVMAASGQVGNARKIGYGRFTVSIRREK